MPPSRAPLSGPRLVATFLAVSLLSGCVAELVEKKKPRKGPVAAVGYIDTGGGEVRYSVEGWGWFVAARRGAALRRMRRVCKGLKSKIVDEFTRDDVDTPYSGAELAEGMARGLQHYNVAPYHHIVFECVQKEAPYSKPSEKPL